MDRCDQEVFDNGVAVAYVNGPRSHTIEEALWHRGEAEERKA